MNDIERRFYSEPAVRNIPVTQLSAMKDIMQKILSDIKEENPYTSVDELLSDDCAE